MAKFSFKHSSITFTAVADTTNYTDAGYMALQGGTTTQYTKISEVYQGGLATASSPTFSVLSRDSTIAATITGLSTGASAAPLDVNTAALAAPVVAFIASTTKPQRAATLGLLSLGYNAFGGIVRWVAYPGEEIAMLGTAANTGEISLSAYTGGTPGISNCHLVFETT